jgi:glycosyltransferase involved in cell wall biosynthesis
VGAAVGGLLTNRPIVILRDRLHAMRTLLRRLVTAQPFDIVHADQTAMAQYALHAAAEQEKGGHLRPRTILDQHNALFVVFGRQAQQEPSFWRRLLWQREAVALRRYETDLCRRFDHVLTVTREDRDHLLNLLPPHEAQRRAERFHPLPICVDPATTDPVPDQAETPRILCLGVMFWPPNAEGALWFVRHVLPLVQQELPEAQLVIVGKNPPPAVRQLADLPGVEVAGFVPDLMPVLATSRLFVVPLLTGGGMRVKILDAWQWGLPIVSTTIGAEGMNVTHGENILLADTAEAFARATLTVLGDPDLAQRLRTNGRRHVLAHYNWQTVYPRIDPLYGGERDRGGR